MRLRDSLVRVAAMPGSTMLVLGLLSAAVAVVSLARGDRDTAWEGGRIAAACVGLAYATRRLDAWIERIRAGDRPT